MSNNGLLDIHVPKDEPIDLRYICRVVIVAAFGLLLLVSLFVLNGLTRLIASLGTLVAAFVLVFVVDWFIKRKTTLSPSEIEKY